MVSRILSSDLDSDGFRAVSRLMLWTRPRASVTTEFGCCVRQKNSRRNAQGWEIVSAKHLLDVKNNSQDVSKPVARHFNQPGHSHNNMKIFGLSLHQGNTESRKCTEQRLIFKIGTLSPAGINERFSFS